MSDETTALKGALLLQSYEAERELESLRSECEQVAEALNTVRDWLRTAHREYSGFADTSHIEARFALLNANLRDHGDEYRRRLNFDGMLQLVDRIRQSGDKLAALKEKRRAAGIP